jgi:hypothetical protein
MHEVLILLLPNPFEFAASITKEPKCTVDFLKFPVSDVLTSHFLLLLTPRPS